MGLSDLIPGMGTVKVAGGALLGAGSAFAVTNWIKSRQKRKLEERLGNVSAERQTRAICRVDVLRELAWADGELDEAEVLYLFRYVIDSPDLQADIKVQLMNEIIEQPSAGKRFWKKLPKTYRKETLIASNEEAHGFLAQLDRMAQADGNLAKTEADLVQKIRKVCDI